MNPGFSNTALSKQEPILILPLVEKLVGKIAALDGKPVNVSTYFDCVTSDIIGKLSFGADFAMLDDPETHPFLHVLPDALRVSVITQCIPEVYRFLSFAYRYGPKFLTPKAFRGVVDFAGKQMRDRAARDTIGSDAEQHDIMSIILNGTADSSDEKDRMDQHEMNGEATTLVTGGGDTVATALTMTMWNLGRHVSIYEDLQSQVRAVFPSYDDITSQNVATKVPLLDAVLNESMRLNPVLPGPMWRRTDKPIVVDNVAVPGGTEVGVMRLSVFHSREAFHKPDQFIPARWLEDMGDNREAFQPFGIGPRTCIGRYIAMVEMRLILAKLLWKFNWELLSKVYDNPEYVVLYRSPLWMKAKLREN